MYLPGADGGCFEMFLEELGEAYSDYHLLVVLDNAPSHTSKHVSHPENVSLLPLPAYSPELNPVPGRKMVFGVQARALQQDFRDHRSATRSAHQDA